MSTDVVPIPRDSENEFDRLLYEGFHLPGVEFYAEIGSGKCLLSSKYTDLMDRLENFEVRDDDIWVATFPKSGTTWTQEMVWCIANNLDFQCGSKVLHSRFPYFEFELFATYLKEGDEPDPNIRKIYTKYSLTCLESMPSPRFIKTHLPWNLLPKQIQSGEKTPKIIYVTRDPRDVCCSFYHHHRLFYGSTGTFEDFVKLFLNDRVNYAPYWDNVNGFMKELHRPNIYHLDYDDMQKDLVNVIKRVAVFLNRHRLMYYEACILKQHLGFDKMQNNKAVNFHDHCIGGLKFLRKGISGSYKEEMTKDMITRFEEWKIKNTKDKSNS